MTQALTVKIDLQLYLIRQQKPRDHNDGGQRNTIIFVKLLYLGLSAILLEENSYKLSRLITTRLV